LNSNLGFHELQLWRIDSGLWDSRNLLFFSPFKLVFFFQFHHSTFIYFSIWSSFSFLSIIFDPCFFNCYLFCFKWFFELIFLLYNFILLQFFFPMWFNSHFFVAIPFTLAFFLIYIFLQFHHIISDKLGIDLIDLTHVWNFTVYEFGWFAPL
jgi:hypothetical protein